MSEWFIQQEFRKRELLHGSSDDSRLAFRRPSEGDDATEEYSSDGDGDFFNDSTSDDEVDEVDEVFYLDKDQMHFDFALCTGDLTQVFTVHLCVFDIRHHKIETWVDDNLDDKSNDDASSTQQQSIPYVLHIMQFEGQHFDYPKFQFQCPLEDGNTVFKNDCFQHLSDVVVDLTSVDYCGFVVEGNDMYAFFNSSKVTREHTDVQTVLSTEALPRLWVTMDEIMNQGTVVGYPIVGDHDKVFLQHPHLIFVKQHGQRAYVPEILYLCDDSDGKYVNLYRQTKGSHQSQEKKEVDEDVEGEVDFLDNRISHPIFGHAYIFSKKPLQPSSSSIFSIRRFVGFCDDAIYLTKPLPTAAASSAAPTIRTMALGDVIPTIVDYFSKGKVDVSGDALLEEIDLSGNDLTGNDDLEEVDLSGNLNVKEVDLSDPVEDLSNNPTSQGAANSWSARFSAFLGQTPQTKEKKMSAVEKPQDPQDDPVQLQLFLSSQPEPCIYFQEIDRDDGRIAYWCIQSDENYEELL